MVESRSTQAQRARRHEADADSVLVIGLGRFGSALATTLDSLDRRVLGVERDPDLIRTWSGRIPLVDLMRTVTSRPAELLGLAAGRLAKGAPADLVLCDLNAPIVVDLDKLKSKSRNSPFDGRRLFGEVQMTIVDGRVVYRV